MELKGKRILITGASGFIGTAVTKELVKYNKVLAVGRGKEIIYPGITFIRGDVTEESFIKSLDLGGVDYIFHLAGNTNHNLAFSDPFLDLKINFFSTFYILEALRNLDIKKRPRLVFASSVLAYGESSEKLNEDLSPTIPTANYGVSKLAAERYLYAFSRQYQISAISLRIFSTYGPGLYQRVIYDLINKLHGNPDSLEILGTGNEARDLVFIDDQIDNIIRVAKFAAYEGEVYNLGSGKSYTTKQIAKVVAISMQLNPKLIFSQEIRSFDVKTTIADTGKIKKLGCKTKTSLDQGIKKTVDWYRLSENQPPQDKND
jgi:UDP-glucose 4-epimerase